MLHEGPDRRDRRGRPAGDQVLHDRGGQADDAGKSTDGWLGITDKYWAVAWCRLASSRSSRASPISTTAGRATRSDYLTDPITVAPGQSATVETLVFAGAKEVAKDPGLRNQDRNIRQFDLLIDWGWFYFITKPMFWLIDWLYKLLGNFGLAILATTVIVKADFLPARQQVLQVDGEHEEGAAQDAGNPRKIRGRQDEAAAGDDGTLQDGEDQSDRRLLADR